MFFAAWRFFAEFLEENLLFWGHLGSADPSTVRGQRDPPDTYGGEEEPERPFVVMDYDAEDRLVKRVHPEGIVEEWEYDPAGRVVLYRDAEAAETRWEYNDRDELSRV